MKATGIVRRIDELGRVVIPKEIRRTLRIREGDPLEIFTDKAGEVILKKYSPIGELDDFAREYAESLHKSVGHISVICDKDTVIAVSGGMRRELADKPIHEDIETAINSRERLVFNRADGDAIPRITADGGESDVYSSMVLVPIVSSGDAIGAVMLLSKEESTHMQQTELKVCETAAGFLGKQMES